jgi:K+-transporting ATPase ATPase C chain
MKNHILPALVMTLCCLVFFCVIYPTLLWGAAQLSAGQGKGETIELNGKAVGFALVGQSFTDDHYFNSRPSAVAYNAAGSAGSNKGPSNADYLTTVQARLDTFLVHNPGVKKAEIPVELITASGSGLDPDLSPRAALVQAPRIARLRKLNEEKLRELVREQTQGPLLGFLGPKKVNILKINIALDKMR